ncbi:lamin-like protein isoform X2 [Linepithema humile]
MPSLHLPISDDLNANKENTELSDIIFTQSSLDKENIESGHTIFKQSSPTHDENPLLNTCYKNAITQTEEHFCDIINMRLNCVTKKFEESEESRKNLEIELNKFKVKYEAAITELNATNSEIIELKNNNNQLRCYKDAITQTEEHFCDIINIRLNCVTKKFEESEESRKNLEIELNEFKAKYEAAITELNATNSEIIELKNNNNQLRCYEDAITQTEEHFCDIINIRLNCVTKKFEESEESRKNLEIELNEFKAKYEAAITELNATNSEIIELKNNNNRLNSCLNKLLTQCQIDIALNKKKYVIWSKDDISRAFALRYYSQQGYRYLKEKLHYPLPGISSLQRWASTINMRQGILKDVLHLMKIKGESLSEIEKVTVLNFGEMKVNALYEYDRKYDEIIGPHQYMHIAMVRSLFGNWKQPVYVQFDTKMTETIIYQIIKELNDISRIQL